MNVQPATTPLDPLEDFGHPVQISPVQFPIGTKVKLNPKAHPSNGLYFVQKALQEIIRDTRRVITSLKKQGFMKDMRGNKMLDFNKQQMRDKLDMMLHADSMEVAGHRPQGMHVTGTIGNECYLRDGQCHSGVRWEVYLLFRRLVNGNHTVYIHPHPIGSEHCFVAVEENLNAKAQV